MEIYPATLARSGDGVVITWSDGTALLYSARALRDACPCATCREKRTAAQPSGPLLPILTPAEAQPLTVTGMQPVGNYAYSIAFSDGHDTGIYPLELLRDLGHPQ
jgi:DUF971 family protein